MTYTTPILLTGDQVAGLTGQPVNQGNPGDANFGMVLPGVDALAGPQATFRLVWFQNLNTSATNFSNGQVWRLERYTGTGDPTTDSQNWAQVPGYQQLSPKNDLVSNVGGGDEYIVFDAGGRFLLYNLNGALPTEPTTLFYPGTAQNGDPTLGDNDGELDFADSYRAYQPVCFCAGTLIESHRGPVKVEALEVGDLVLTLDRGLEPVRWIGRRRISLAEAVAYPEVLPVRIAPGALGPGLPIAALELSPQHRVMLRSRIAERMTGRAEALVAVKHLCGLPGIAQGTVPREVDYLHLRLERHEVVRANGLWAETLLVGPGALRAMGPAARAELRLLFPGLVEGPADATRPVLDGRQARRFLLRHQKNRAALIG